MHGLARVYCFAPCAAADALTDLVHQSTPLPLLWSVQAPVKWCAPIESILHEQALLFVNGLMAPPMANRPTAEQALQHSFLSAACLVSAEKDMRLCLPGFDAKRDLLPVVPVGRSCHLPAAAMGGGWGIAALHATPPMQPHATQALGVVPNPAATQQADWDSLSPDSAAAAPTGHRYDPSKLHTCTRDLSNCGVQAVLVTSASIGAQTSDHQGHLVLGCSTVYHHC